MCSHMANPVSRWKTYNFSIPSGPSGRGHRTVNPDVSGSSPLLGAKFWGCSSTGRAPALQAGGWEFDPPQFHQNLTECSSVWQSTCFGSRGPKVQILVLRPTIYLGVIGSLVAMPLWKRAYVGSNPTSQTNFHRNPRVVPRKVRERLTWCVVAHTGPEYPD